MGHGRAASNAPVGGAAPESARLTARVALLLEETAQQGLVALRLLIEASDLLTVAPERDDRATLALVADLERRIATVEREGRERLRLARRLLRPKFSARAVKGGRAS